MTFVDSLTQEGSTANEIDFTFGSGAEYVHSCVAVLDGEFHVFGGKNKNKQHSVLVANGCKLKRDGELPMPHAGRGWHSPLAFENLGTDTRWRPENLWGLLFEEF